VTQLYGSSGYTDHYPIFQILKRSIIREQPPRTISRRRINKTTEETFKQTLQSADFTLAYSEDPNVFLDNIMKVVMKAHDSSFPLETVKTVKLLKHKKTITKYKSS
jgi:hypothetical protein